MEYQNVFLDEDYTVTIRCPNCMHEKVVPFQKLPKQHRIKLRCKCESVFWVQIELRKTFRRDVNLDGRFINYYQDKRWGKTLSESQLTNIKPINCKVANLSLKGIAFLIPKNVKVEEGDHMSITFILDNSVSAQVEKETIVRSVIGTRIGCEFIDSVRDDSTLGFYFL